MVSEIALEIGRNLIFRATTKAKEYHADATESVDSVLLRVRDELEKALGKFHVPVDFWVVAPPDLMEHLGVMTPRTDRKSCSECGRPYEKAPQPFGIYNCGHIPVSDGRAFQCYEDPFFQPDRILVGMKGGPSGAALRWETSLLAAVNTTPPLEGFTNCYQGRLRLHENVVDIDLGYLATVVFRPDKRMDPRLTATA